MSAPTEKVAILPIVEQLRADEVRQTITDGPDPLCAEAADTIEELYEALNSFPTPSKNGNYILDSRNILG